MTDNFRGSFTIRMFITLLLRKSTCFSPGLSKEERFLENGWIAAEMSYRKSVSGYTKCC